MFTELASLRHECMVCGKVYKFPETLRRHIRYQCGGKKEFPCNKCGRCFTANSSLMRHKLTFHTRNNERPLSTKGPKAYVNFL